MISEVTLTVILLHNINVFSNKCNLGEHKRFLMMFFYIENKS